MGIPGLLAYIYAFILLPLTGRSGGRNDLDVYLKAASDMASGRDPYGDFAAVTRHVDPTLTGGYIYPPGLAWYLQPLAALPRPAAHAIVAVALQLLLAGSLAAILTAVGPSSRRARAAVALMVIGFFPLWQNLIYQQVNLLLLALSSLFLLSWSQASAARRSGQVIGGLAAGVAAGIKLIQAPNLVLIGWRRRWSMLPAAAVGVGVILLAGFPWLEEYATRVLPRVGQGTGWVLNQAPAALVARVLHPVSFYRTTPDTGAEIAVTSAILAVAVVATSAWTLRHRPVDRRGRRLEAAVVVAATPVVLPLSWDTHLVLLLLPMIVLAADSARRHDHLGLAGAATAWALLGPVHLLYVLLFVSLLQGSSLTAALTTGHPGGGVDLVLRAGAELGPIGIVLLWIGCMRAYSTSYAWTP